jgi:hypothetical protein
MTTYELFLCWIIVMLLVMLVGEASIIKLGVTVAEARKAIPGRTV